MTTTMIAQTETLSTLMNLEAAGVITPVSLDLRDPNMTFESWENVGRYLGSIDRASRYWLGDWIVAGEALYGEDHAQAIEADKSERFNISERVTGLDHQTLLNVSSVCRRVPKDRRRVELFFGHHAVVAPLFDAPQEQSEWLQKAIDNEWSVSDLRAALRAANAPEPEAEPEQPSGGADRVTLAERLLEAASLVDEQAQATSDGDFLVPAAPIHQLRAALGKE